MGVEPGHLHGGIVGAGSMSVQSGPGALIEVLEASRDRGFLGPGDIEEHLTHARAFATCVHEPAGRCVDLGSGGGVPGLVLAVLVWPETEFVLLDGSRTRATFLEEAVEQLELGPRVSVCAARAEEAGRMASLRSTAEVVVSRSFGPPPVVAECAAPLLAVGGTLVVSEPPGGGPIERWPVDGLALVGLEVVARPTGPPAFLVARQEVACPDRYPRRVGIPAKRPLF